MRVEIQVDGARRVLDTSKTVDRELVKGIRDAVRISARELRNDARRRVPKFTGNMRRAIKYKSWSRFLSATVFVDRKIAPHTHLVLHGRRPGKSPSPKEPALVEWARRHGMSVHVLVRKIAEKGTHAAASPDFMQESLVALRAPIIARIRQAFEQAVRRGGRGR